MAQAPYFPAFGWKYNLPFPGPMELTLLEVEALRAESGIWLFCIPSICAQLLVAPGVKPDREMVQINGRVFNYLLNNLFNIKYVIQTSRTVFLYC